MPRREEKPKGQRTEYSYEKLLEHIRNVINEEHGGVAKFVESQAFIQCGFKATATEKRNFFTHLAKQSDPSKTSKSVPVLTKLYKGLLNVDLSSQIQVVRTQLIFSEDAIF